MTRSPTPAARRHRQRSAETRECLIPTGDDLLPASARWGILSDVQAFKQYSKAMLFASGTYLANPRDTNGTPSILVGLGVANPTFAQEGILVNSVPDQYLVRMGAVMPIGKTGLGASLAYRIEGLPRYDLIGDSHGWEGDATFPDFILLAGVSYGF